jgi:hypothetical protein
MSLPICQRDRRCIVSSSSVLPRKICDDYRPMCDLAWLKSCAVSPTVHVLSEAANLRERRTIGDSAFAGIELSMRLPMQQKLCAFIESDIEKRFIAETFSCPHSDIRNPMNLKPIPEKICHWKRGSHRKRTSARLGKKRAELRRRGLPMIIWKDGKVREVPAGIRGTHASSVLVAASCRNELFPAPLAHCHRHRSFLAPLE